MSKVFIVYGRNTAAFEAMSKFLDAIGLEPLRWEGVVAATGIPSPHNMTAIHTSMREASAVVVLLTGDDQARLRSQYGDEEPRFQPRVNVIFELGLAYGLLGTSKVILVRSDSSRKFSDIEGLNALTMNNSSEKREALISRLETAGCDIDRNSFRDEIYDPQAAGDFEKAFEIEDSGPRVLSRGSFDGFLTDAAVGYKRNQVDLIKELEDRVVQKRSPDLKYAYFSYVGARNWSKLCEQPTYQHNEQTDMIVEAIPKLFDRIFDRTHYVDFISLGPGDGLLDKRVIEKLSNIVSIKNYYPIDLSYDLIQSAMINMSGLLREKDIGSKPLVPIDFEDLPSCKPVYCYDEHPNIFSLLGYTFGNYTEYQMLQSLRDGMNDGDYLLFDVRLGDEDEANKLASLLAHAPNNRFAFSPVELVTDAKYSDASINQRVSQEYSTVNNAYNIVTYCDNFSARVRSTSELVQHGRMDLAFTTLYSVQELIKWLHDKKFEIVSHDNDDSAAIFLVRKI